METTITQGDVKILKPFKVDIGVRNQKLGEYHTGVDILCDAVYSPFPGTVVFVGKDAYNIISVILQYDNKHAVMYKNLKSTGVSAGEIVDSYHEIGKPDKFVHFEYLYTEEPAMFSVKLANQQFYKHDPMDLLLNGYDSWLDYGQEVSITQSLYGNVVAEEVYYGD